jgi:hypothetical protein
MYNTADAFVSVATTRPVREKTYPDHNANTTSRPQAKVAAAASRARLEPSRPSATYNASASATGNATDRTSAAAPNVIPANASHR